MIVKRFFMCLVGILFFSYAYGENIVIGYLPSWVDWEVKDIKADKLDIIKLSFILVKDGKAVFGEDSPNYNFEEQLIKLGELKKKNNRLKIVLAVGGMEKMGFQI